MAKNIYGNINTWTESCKGDRDTHVAGDPKCSFRIDWKTKPIGS